MGKWIILFFRKTDLVFTDNEQLLADASFYIITVPTPIDSQNNPDLGMLKTATETVAKNLSKGDYVVVESTVYPGVTEDICIPILENISGLKVGAGFKAAFPQKESTLETKYIHLKIPPKWFQDMTRKV